MKKNFFKSVEIKIAIFALAGLFLLVWGINFLRGIDIFKKQYAYHVIFENTSGLLPAHAVTINGMSVGTIDKIQLMRHLSNKVLVTMNINKEIEIPVNSIVRIISPSPLSSPQIEIVFSNETDYFSQGDTIQGMLTEGLLSGLGDAMEPLKNIIISLDTSITLLKQTLQSGVLTDVEATMKNLHATTDKLDNLLAANTGKINTVVSDIQTFTTTLQKNNDKIHGLVNNLHTVSESLAEAELKKTINNAANAIGKLDSLINGVNQGEGTLGQLMVNDSLYINLQSSIVSLNNLLVDIKENPKRYINITVFEKKEKRK
ncbi:MAG: MlaD family protein [Bacteroidales bacterium]|jgi:phospholipid/cholesterol/gamma-HCH transport system substrate-binding protein|nr:MlaD family protein [Bacteroidales bacterium]